MATPACTNLRKIYNSLQNTLRWWFGVDKSKLLKNKVKQISFSSRKIFIFLVLYPLEHNIGEHAVKKSDRSNGKFLRRI